MHHNESTCLPIFSGEPIAPGCLPDLGRHTYQPPFKSLHSLPFRGKIINGPRATDQQTQSIQHEAMYQNKPMWFPVFSVEPKTPGCLPDSGYRAYKPPLESLHSSTFPGNIMNGPRATDQQTQPIQLVAMHHNESTGPTVFSIEPNTPGCLPVLAHHTYQQPFKSPHDSPFPGNIMNGLRGTGPNGGKNTVIPDNHHHEVGKKEHPRPLCPKVFPTPTAQNVHIRTHTGEKPYECNQGKKAFSQSHHLKRHLPTHTGKKFSKCKRKTGEKKHSCPLCNKFLQSSYGLKIHIRTHTSEKPFKCDDCDRVFSLKENLKIHIRTHTGEKPYECDYCSRAFSQRIHLERHFRMHTGEKPYNCDHCEKAFSQSQNLKKHLCRLFRP